MQVPGKAEVLPPSAGSRGTSPGCGEQSRSRGALPKHLLSLPSREKELAALKEQVNTLRASVAKEEEKVAELKLKVQLFSSGEHEGDDQVQAGILARRVHMCTSGSCPPATSILGAEHSGLCTEHTEHTGVH